VRLITLPRRALFREPLSSLADPSFSLSQSTKFLSKTTKMFATRLFHLLTLAVAVLCVVQGSWWDEHRLPNRGARAMIRRQDDGPSTPGAGPASTASSAPPQASETSSAPPESSSAPPPEESSSSAPPPESLSTNAPQPSSSAEPTQSSSREVESTTAPPESSKTSESSEEPTSSSKSEEKEDNTTKTKSMVVSTSTDIVTKTRDDGSKETVTNITKHTSSPDLSDDGDSGSSGMTPKTRNTIIGVVVGVGGAIVIGALALVAWRIWGKKKQAEENDGLMAYDNTAYGGAEHKSEISHSPSASTSQRSPFQSTLENYHQPSNVNASSNF
jgi:hypothetical protein